MYFYQYKEKLLFKRLYLKNRLIREQFFHFKINQKKRYYQYLIDSNAYIYHILKLILVIKL
ncbi:TPA: hypothetical protein ACSO34_002677, partial [Staphylococcus aureus]